jgi:hypothetical protein
MVRRRRTAQAVPAPLGNVTPEMKPAMFVDDNTDPANPLPRKSYVSPSPLPKAIE